MCFIQRVISPPKSMVHPSCKYLCRLIRGRGTWWWCQNWRRGSMGRGYRVFSVLNIGSLYRPWPTRRYIFCSLVVVLGIPRDYIFLPMSRGLARNGSSGFSMKKVEFPASVSKRRGIFFCPILFTWVLEILPKKGRMQLPYRPGFKHHFPPNIFWIPFGQKLSLDKIQDLIWILHRRMSRDQILNFV